MATNFPSSVDTFPSQATLAADTLATGQHSTQHDNLGDAVTAIETALLAGAFGGGSGGPFINIAASPYLCDMTGANKSGGNGTARDGSDSTHGLLKAIYDAVTTGKEIWAPPGTVDCRKDDGTSALAWIDLSVHKRRVLIRGSGQATTVFKWPSKTNVVSNPADLVLGGDPSGRVASFAMDAYNSNNTNWSIDLSDLTLQGPGSYGDPSDAEDRRDMWALRMGGRIRVQRCEMTGWHSAGVYRVRNPDHNIDHNTMRDCDLHDNFYNLYWSYYWPVSGANSGDGDHVIDNVSMSQASKACRAVDPAAAVFDSEIMSCHGGFSPFGWYSEYGPQAPVTLPTGGGGATVARDAAGVITIDTKIAASTPPWGVFDNSDKPWNHGTTVACGGFIVGDVIDIDDVAASGHAAGSLASVSSCIGRIATKVGTVITVLMEHPAASSAFSATAVTAGSLTSHYNQVRMLDSNVEFGGTYEGCGNSNIFAPNRSVLGFGSASQIPFHGLMSVDNNKGSDNAYSPIPLLSLVRVNLTNPGQTHASPGDIMQITGKVDNGIPMGPSDNWFINTPTSGTWQDDNPPTTGWQSDVDRIRGMANILTAVDNTDGGTTLTFTFQQIATAKNNYTEKTLGNGTSGSAGTTGRCAGFVVQIFEDHQGPTFDISAHPPDNSSIGGNLAANELVVSQMHRCRFHMLQPSAFYPRLMQGVPDISTEPVRSTCLIGDMEFPITHTTAAVASGDILEFFGRDDVRPFQGGTIAGVALWDRPTSGDYIAYISKGILRSQDGYQAQGIKSTVAFAQGDLIAADSSNHGRGKAAGSGAAIIGRATAASTGPVGGIYITPVRIGIRNPIP